MGLAILAFRGTALNILMLPPYWWGSWELWECVTLSDINKETPLKQSVGELGCAQKGGVSYPPLLALQRRHRASKYGG